MSNLGPRPKIVGFVRVSHARFCIYSTRKTMGAIGHPRRLLEVIHRKAFTLTVGSFSRVQNAWYEPKPQCMMKFLSSTIEFQREIFQVNTMAIYNTMENSQVNVFSGTCQLLRRHCLRRRRNLPRGFILVTTESKFPEAIMENTAVRAMLRRDTDRYKARVPRKSAGLLTGGRRV